MTILGCTRLDKSILENRRERGSCEDDWSAPDGTIPEKPGNEKSRPKGGFFQSQGGSLGNADVDRAQLAAVFRVGFGVVGHLLALFQRFIAFALDGGKVHENVVASVVVGNEAKALLSVEPFDSTVIHNQYLLQNIVLQNRANKKPPLASQNGN